eukprot:g968.t1
MSRPLEETSKTISLRANGKYSAYYPLLQDQLLQWDSSIPERKGWCGSTDSIKFSACFLSQKVENSAKSFDCATVIVAPQSFSRADDGSYRAKEDGTVQLLWDNSASPRSVELSFAIKVSATQAKQKKNKQKKKRKSARGTLTMAKTTYRSPFPGMIVTTQYGPGVLLEHSTDGKVPLTYDDVSWRIKLSDRVVEVPPRNVRAQSRRPQFDDVRFTSDVPLLNKLPDVIGSVLKKIAGASTGKPEELAQFALPETKVLLERVWNNLDPSRVIDWHTHIVGTGFVGGSASGCWCNFKSIDPVADPKHYVKMRAFMSAGGVSNGFDGGDRIFLERLVDLIRHTHPLHTRKSTRAKKKRRLSKTNHPRHMLLAFDATYDENGRMAPERTTIYVPNEYTWKCSQMYPDCFIAACSVHPYRLDCVAELRRWASHGVRLIKWLPNSMGIDAESPLCDRFYDAVKKLGMVLLCHVGDEHSVDAAFLDNELGNPLKLRRALDCGVRVVAAHCASEGKSSDLDLPLNKRKDSEKIENFDLWLRLMNEKKYEKLLFGDCAAMCSVKRLKFFGRLLAMPHLHHRLVHGSDYPVPAVNLNQQLVPLLKADMLEKEDLKPLRQIYNYNPLLFEMSLKRSLVCPRAEAEKAGLKIKLNAKGRRPQALPVTLFYDHPMLQGPFPDVEKFGWTADLPDHAEDVKVFSV